MSDGVAYVMLLLLAMLDTSGGLLLLPILLLVTMRVVQFKFYLLLSIDALGIGVLGQRMVFTRLVQHHAGECTR